MRIYIPSRGRADITRTFLNLPPVLQKKAVYVVPREELGVYSKAGFSCVSPPPSIDRIAVTRQWIVEYHLKNHPETDKLIMLDDDLSFRAYDPFISCKYGAVKPDATIAAFKELETLLNTYAHGGILMQLGSNRHEDAPAPMLNTRACRAIAFRASVLKQHWPATKFGPVPVQDDFHTTLALLELGYPNAITTIIAQDQTGGSGARGGASTYRDMAYHAASVRKLKELHPEFVRIVDKPALKTTWGNEPRIDVVCSWKKALEAGIAKHGVRKLRKAP